MSSGAAYSARLGQVSSWLDAGWQIEEPVIQRSVYYTNAGRVCALELVLSSGDARRVVALEDAPAVQAFLKQRQLRVLDLA